MSWKNCDMRVRIVTLPIGETTPAVDEQDLNLLETHQVVNLSSGGTVSIKPIGDNYVEVRIED